MPDTPTVTIALDRHEAAALRAWLDVATPERCGSRRHDSRGFAIPSDVADYHAGYCPGDLATLDSIAAELDAFLR